MIDTLSVKKNRAKKSRPNFWSEKKKSAEKKIRESKKETFYLIEKCFKDHMKE